MHQTGIHTLQKKSYLKSLVSGTLLHVAVLATATISFGASFDAWWHVSKGRDSFFVLPHLFIFTAVFFLLLLSFYAWRNLKLRQWKPVFLWMLLVPISLPIDQLWHYYRGNESVTSILIVWSPPHVLLFLGAIGSFAYVSLLIKKEKTMIAREIFGSLLIASLLNVVFIITGPFFPFSPFAVAGFFGAAVASFVVVYLFLYARRTLPNTMPAFMVAAFSALLLTAFSDSNAVYGSRAIGTYPLIPNWIVLLGQIAPATIIDLMPTSSSRLVGALAGMGFGIVLYAVSYNFIDTLFQPTTAQILIAILCSTFGGFEAGVISDTRK